MGSNRGRNNNPDVDPKGFDSHYGYDGDDVICVGCCRDLGVEPVGVNMDTDGLFCCRCTEWIPIQE